MLDQRDFAGGVFDGSLDGGRAGATVSAGYAGVEAKTPDGRMIAIGYMECRLEIGGASGRMIFCRNPAKTTTIFCEERGFLEALEESSRGVLYEQIEDLRRQHGQNRRSAFGWTVVILVVCAVLLVGGYFGVVAAAKAAIRAVPVSVDKQIGQATLGSMTLEGPVVDQPEVVAAVRKIVDQLKPHANPRDFNYEVKIVDAPIVNAFALPGGYIVIYTGLLKQAKTVDQIAGVLAHEMGHVVKRHGLQRVAQSLGVVAAVQIMIGDVGGLTAIVVELGKSSALTSYSRSHEAEADSEAVRILHAAKIDPKALSEFFKIMEQEQEKAPEILAFLHTHPSTEKRIAEINRQLEALPQERYLPLDVDWKAVQAKLGVNAAGDAPLEEPQPKNPKD